MNNWQNIQAFIDTRPRRWLACSIAGIAIYLLLGVFWGFDVCDNGQYMTFYANIFTAPETVGYHFMYYLSGLIGGSALYAFPAMGLLGIRLMGVLCFMACLYLIWKILKSHISTTAILIGGLLAILSYVPHQISFFYNTLTILLYLLAIERIQKSTIFSCLLGGVLLGLNVFSRTPNVLGWTLAAMPLLCALCDHTSLRRAMWRVLAGIVGILIGVVVTIGIMKDLGHWDIYTNNLNTLGTIASDESGESTHSFLSLIMVQLVFYFKELIICLFLVVLVGAYSALHRRTSSKAIRATLLFFSLCAFFAVAIRQRPMQILWAVSATGCLYCIWTNYGNLRKMAITAFYLMLIIPMGCDFVYNTGSIPIMLAAPFAVVICIKYADKFRTGYFIAAFTIVCIAKMVTNGAYFDGGPLWKKTATINSPRAAGILTTPERAAIVNDALKGIQPWVKPGDTLLVYGSMPMLNYLTDTRPAMDCCWPELLSTSLLNNRLEKCNGHLPFILRQKFLSMGSTFSEPTDSLLTTYGRHADNMFYFDTKIAALNDFLTENHYQKVFENTHFVLYTPQKNAKKPTCILLQNNNVAQTE